MAALMFAAFSTGMIINLSRGRAIDCGCVGAAAHVTISWILVVRNVALILMAAVVAITAEASYGFSAQTLPFALTLVAAVILLRLVSLASRAYAAVGALGLGDSR